MRMEVTDFFAVLFNPVAQSKFVHTVSAGYVTGAMFVLSISAYYLLHGRHLEFAKRSMTVAASFGLASALSVVVLGDESGYTTTEHQKVKLAAMEGLWHSEPAPAGLTIIGLPSQESRETRYAIHVPWVLGLIATRSITTVVPGLFDLVDEAKTRIRRGLEGYAAVQRLRSNPQDNGARKIIGDRQNDLGYAMLLRRYVDDPTKASDRQIEQAAWDTVPNVPTLFWSFRIMVALGFYFIALFAVLFSGGIADPGLERVAESRRICRLLHGAPRCRSLLDDQIRPHRTDGILGSARPRREAGVARRRDRRSHYAAPQTNPRGVAICRFPSTTKRCG